jgi:hypothetical protein
MTYLTSMPHWAHACWSWLHSCEHIDVSTIMLLARVLPCPVCRKHMNSYIESNEITNPVNEWLFRFHNDVNVRCRKPVIEIADVQEAVEYDDAFVRFVFAASFISHFEKGGRRPFLEFVQHATKVNRLPLFQVPDNRILCLPKIVHIYFTSNNLYAGTYDEMISDYIKPSMWATFRNDDKEHDSVHLTTYIIVLLSVLIFLLLIGTVKYFMQ